MMDLTGFSMDNLEGLTAADVMEVNVACIKEDGELEDMLHLLVDQAFLPIVNEGKCLCRNHYPKKRNLKICQSPST